GNTSNDGGGGICNSNNSQFEMLDCRVENNYSRGKGGGIYNNGTFTISGNSSIIDNKALDVGGGVCNDSNGTFEIFGCKVQDNSTSGSVGGGIHNSGKFKIAKGSSITGNTAFSNGGGVYNSSSQFEMLDCRVEDNHSSIGNGGGACVSDGTFTISGDSSITGNTSLSNGGGIYFSSGNLTLSDSPTILNNYSFGTVLNNIHLFRGKKITVKELTGGSVGVYMVSPGVFTQEADFDNDSEAQAIFSSDANAYMVTADSSKQAELTACYYVEFDVDGGSQVEARKIKPEVGAVLGALPTTTREGYTFDGWWNREYKAAYGSDSPVSGNLILYAKWLGHYTITFNTKGRGNAPAAQTVSENSKATKPADPVAQGYTFLGWYTDEACTEAYDFETAVTKDIILYAKWESDSPTEEEIISQNTVSMDKVTLVTDYEVTYPSLLPYSFNKAKSKDFYRIFGMTVSSNTSTGVEYAVTKGKLVVVKIKDGDGTYTLDHYIQITGLTPMEKGQLKTTLTKEEKKAAKALAKKLKAATKVDKKAAKTGVGKSTAGIHVEMYPYTLSEENVADSDNGLKNLVLSGKSGKYQLKYTYNKTNKKGKVKDGKKDAQKDPAVVTYDEGTGLITVSSCEIVGKIAVNSDKVTNKTKDIK
nr:InlB B-repeat-containing protein [Lachnospiraceae bacterium]